MCIRDRYYTDSGCQKDLQLQESLYGKDGRQVAMPLLGLSQTLWVHGKAEEAEELARRALVITENALGPDHMDTGYCRGYVAMTLQAQSKYTAAEPLYQQALAAMEEPEHPEYATMLASYSENCIALGKKQVARHAFERALKHADWS